MGILAGKRILITGVLTDSSIAFHVAKVAQQEGATVVLTGYGRLSLVERIAKRLPDPPPVLELDVTDPDHLDSLTERASAYVDRLDGVVHAIGYAPQEALGGNFLNTTWDDVATAVQVSTYSLKSLAVAALPMMTGGGSIVGLDFDASEERWSSLVTSSSRTGGGDGSRLAIRSTRLSLPNPVSTTVAPSCWATRATWNAIEASVMTPVTRMRLPARIPMMISVPSPGRRRRG